jgi:hypothetical protein
MSPEEPHSGDAPSDAETEVVHSDAHRDSEQPSSLPSVIPETPLSRGEERCEVGAASDARTPVMDATSSAGARGQRPTAGGSEITMHDAGEWGRGARVQQAGAVEMVTDSLGAMEVEDAEMVEAGSVNVAGAGAMCGGVVCGED